MSWFRIKQLSDTKAALFQQCDLQTQQLREKNIGIQFIQDELATLRLEIITTEERSKKLEKENAQLLERWINKMNEEAEKMNEATQFYEGFLEQARTIGRTLRKSGGKWVMQPDSTAGSIQEVPNEKSQTSQRFVSSTLLPTHSYKKIVAHEGEIYCVHASSTGTMFATGATDKKIKIYDAKTGSVSQTLGGSLKTITSIDFNSTDTFVLGSSTDNSSRAWQLSTGRIKHTFTGHIGKVSAAKFTGDSHKIVTASHDRTLKVWDFQKGDCRFTLVSGHLDGNLRLWDTRTGKGIKELAGVHVGQITSVGIRPNTFTVLTNSRDNVLKLVDLRIYDTLQTYQADSFRNGINWSRACFSPDGCYIAAGSADGTLHIWNTETGKLKTTMKEHSDAICGVSWNPTGSFLYSADKNKTVHMWDTSLPTTA
ncbi:WD40-repeat-containing domain protein [Spinellus fusiger]|nr:WD40-repeat-containing domain protein [Spinellus fusiger]